MKPRVEDFVANEVLTHTHMNTIQDRLADLTKNNGVWLVQPPRILASTEGTSLIIGPHKGVVIGGIELAPASAAVLTFSGQFSSNGWWYVYAKNDTSDGTGYTFSSTAPDDELVFESGNTDHRFVCSLYVYDHTATAEKIIPFFKSGNRTTFQYSAGTASALTWQSLNPGTGTSSSFADVTLRVPPSSRLAHIRLKGKWPDGDSSDVIDIKTKGDPSYFSFTPPDGAFEIDHAHIEIPVDANGKIQYRIAGTSSQAATIWTTGYVE